MQRLQICEALVRLPFVTISLTLALTCFCSTANGFSEAIAAMSKSIGPVAGSGLCSWVVVVDRPCLKLKLLGYLFRGSTTGLVPQQRAFVPVQPLLPISHSPDGCHTVPRTVAQARSQPR